MKVTLTIEDESPELLASLLTGLLGRYVGYDRVIPGFYVRASIGKEPSLAQKAISHFEVEP